MKPSSKLYNRTIAEIKDKRINELKKEKNKLFEENKTLKFTIKNMDIAYTELREESKKELDELKNNRKSSPDYPESEDEWEEALRNNEFDVCKKFNHNHSPCEIIKENQEGTSTQERELVTSKTAPLDLSYKQILMQFGFNQAKVEFEKKIGVWMVEWENNDSELSQLNYIKQQLKNMEVKIMTTEKDYAGIVVSKKFLNCKEFTGKEKDVFIEFIRSCERKETIEEFEKKIRKDIHYSNQIDLQFKDGIDWTLEQLDKLKENKQ